MLKFQYDFLVAAWQRRFLMVFPFRRWVGKVARLGAVDCFMTVAEYYPEKIAFGSTKTIVGTSGRLIGLVGPYGFKIL